MQRTGTEIIDTADIGFLYIGKKRIGTSRESDDTVFPQILPADLRWNVRLSHMDAVDLHPLLPGRKYNIQTVIYQQGYRFLPSCRGNDRRSLACKANEFPVRDEAQRCALPTGQLTTESPRLLDPCVQADCELLAHGIDGEVKPVAPDGTWEYTRARYTIDRLGFNEWNTPEDKRSRWQTLATLLAVVGNTSNPAVISEINKHLSHDHEYASFFRSAIGTC